jgi:hypothetical protein
MKEQQAFPTIISGEVLRGMSLRDYFAAKAMQAILTDGSWHGHTCKTAANTAYEMADAMIYVQKQRQE